MKRLFAPSLRDEGEAIQRAASAAQKGSSRAHGALTGLPRRLRLLAMTSKRAYAKSIFLLLLLLPCPALAMPVVADLSNYHIDINARFIGTKLFLFGTREEGGDVIVVVRGPESDFIVRKKERIGGIWISREYVEFAHMPAFYAVASSRPLETMQHVRMAEGLALSDSYFGVVEDAYSRKLDIQEYKDALLHYLQTKMLYRPATQLQFMGETLFKASLDFPANLPKGNYTAEIYLIRDDHVIGQQILPIVVQKIGLEATIADLAHHQPVFYGLLSILMALSAGWFANRIFNRR